MSADPVTPASPTADVYLRWLPADSRRTRRLLCLTDTDLGLAHKLAEAAGGLVVAGLAAGETAADCAEHADLVVSWADRSDRARLCALYEWGPFDVIVDAGRHAVEAHLRTIECLFPALTPGGALIIEDIAMPRDEGASANLLDLLARLGEGMARGQLAIEAFDGEIVQKCLAGVTFEASRAILRRAAGDFGPPLFRALPLAEVGEDVVEVLASEPYVRTEPEIDSDLAWMHERLADYAGRTAHPPPGLMATIPRAIVFGEGIVTDRSGRLVIESLMNQRQAQRLPYMRKMSDGFYAMADFQALEQVAGDTVFCVKQRWDTNYGHWLVESLPRVGLVGQYLPLDRCRFLVTAWTEAMSRVMQQSLVLAGAREENILQVSGGPLAVDDLVYITPTSAHPFLFHPHSARFLRALAVKHMAAHGTRPDAATKVYVSRNKGSSRRLVNEDEVVALLAPRGYVTVYPERHSFLEQIEIFGRCTHVVGNLGAAMTNVVFGEDGVNLLALTSEFMPDDFFWDLTSHRGGRYFSLHGKVAARSEGTPEMNADFAIDVEKLERMLGRFERQ